MRMRVVNSERIGSAPIIGLIGRQGSGKTTFASQLQARGASRYHVIDPLRHAAAAFFGVELDRFDGYLKDRPVPGRRATPRDLLNTLGQHLHTAFPTELADRLRERIEAARGSGRSTVVEGLRRAEEVAVVTLAGGTLVRIIRPGLPEPEDTASQMFNNLSDSIPTAIEIINDGTLADLDGVIQPLMERLRR